MSYQVRRKEHAKRVEAWERWRKRVLIGNALLQAIRLERMYSNGEVPRTNSEVVVHPLILDYILNHECCTHQCYTH